MLEAIDLSPYLSTRDEAYPHSTKKVLEASGYKGSSRPIHQALVKAGVLEEVTVGDKIKLVPVDGAKEYVKNSGNTLKWSDLGVAWLEETLAKTFPKNK